MARSPYQVLVIPFRRRLDGGYEVAILRRSDDGSWQGVAGGGEDGEPPHRAAARECEEELGVDPHARLFSLSTLSSVPAGVFAARPHWPQTTYVVPEHAFAIDCTDQNVRLSAEHSAVEWLAPDAAMRRLRWDSNRTAVYELVERLEKSDLHLISR